MLIGFSNGDYYKTFKKQIDGISNEFIQLYKANGLTNAIEINCVNEDYINFLLDSDVKLNTFEFISLHMPSIQYKKDQTTKNIIEKMGSLKQKYNIKNFVFHPDVIQDRDLFLWGKNLPISIENMDNKKSIGKTLEEIKYFLNKYDLKLTLDLQHCFTNDPSMELAKTFQKDLGDKILEYHVSGFDDIENHTTLFQTQQDIILDSLEFFDKPIIIESSFKKKGNHIEELDYIKEKLNKNKTTNRLTLIHKNI